MDSLNVVMAATNIGFAARLADVAAMVILSLLCFIRAGRIPIAIGIGLLFVNLYFYIFNKQRLWADGILMPHLHKALPVACNYF
jgi:nicotinamide riboside transporter PnuC